VLAEDLVEERAVASMMLRDTQRAFDGVAAGYDRSNAANRMLVHMRARAWQAVDAFVPQHAHVIDLGCGPGCDAEHLAERGYRVTAIDWSHGMVDEARRRVAAAGLIDRVDVLHVGIHELDRLAPVQFDAAYSNFGPLNCVDDLAGAAQLIAGRLRPGGILVASMIGRVCPWEIALYPGARGGEPSSASGAIRCRCRSKAAPSGRATTPPPRSNTPSPRPGSRARRFARSACSRRRRIWRPSRPVIRISSRRCSVSRIGSAAGRGSVRGAITF
jgi:SAM-dependent methyltransferase